MMLQHLQTGEDLLAIADNDGYNEAQMEREKDHFQFGLHCCCLDAEFDNLVSYTVGEEKDASDYLRVIS